MKDGNPLCFRLRLLSIRRGSRRGVCFHRRIKRSSHIPRGTRECTRIVYVQCPVLRCSALLPNALLSPIVENQTILAYLPREKQVYAYHLNSLHINVDACDARKLNHCPEFTGNRGLPNLYPGEGLVDLLCRIRGGLGQCYSPPHLSGGGGFVGLDFQ